MCQESMRGTVMCSRKCCVKTCEGGRQLLVTIFICGLGAVRMIVSTAGKHCYACITASQVMSPQSLQASVNNKSPLTRTMCAVCSVVVAAKLCVRICNHSYV